MPDFDDFDLDRTPDREGAPRPYRPSPSPPPRGRLFPALLALLAIVAVGLLAVVFFVFRTPAGRKASVATPSPPALPAATPAPTSLLPSLDDSDGFARDIAAGLAAHPELAFWLARTALIRTLTVVVVNVAEGDSPRPHLDFLAPKQRFRAGSRGRRTTPDPRGFEGYNTFAHVVASLDAQACARGYRTLEPLFETAYRELGHPEGGFATALDRAIHALLAAPVLGEDVALVPHAIGFRYVDPRLEALTAAQKQFLRTGPRNVRLVQGKLRELAAALAPRPSPRAP